MTGPLKAPCGHGRYDAHQLYEPGLTNEFCPGGSLLPEDTLIIVKDTDGEWSHFIFEALSDALDALAAAQPGES